MYERVAEHSVACPEINTPLGVIRVNRLFRNLFIEVGGRLYLQSELHPLRSKLIFSLVFFLFVLINFSEPALAGGDKAGKPIEFDELELRKAWCSLYALAEGAWGGLVVTAAGIGTIVASVTGQYRAAYTFLVTAISAFALRSFVSLWFGSLEGCVPGGELSPFPKR